MTVATTADFARALAPFAKLPTRVPANWYAPRLPI
jgi:hypothetical protein